MLSRQEDADADMYSLSLDFGKPYGDLDRSGSGRDNRIRSSL
jgi:hypothetical protein